MPAQPVHAEFPLGPFTPYAHNPIMRTPVDIPRRIAETIDAG